MINSNNLKWRLAFLGEGEVELKFLEAVFTQISAPSSRVYSTTQSEEYRRSGCDYCVLYPSSPSDEVIKSLVSVASDCPVPPKIILLLMKQKTTGLEKAFKEMGTQPQIIRLENPDLLRAVELINSFFILEEKFEPPYPGWEFFGASEPVHELYDSIKKFARWGKEPVLISGPTGTGKELIAKLLHSIRGVGDFRAYNLAAIPVELAESLLFGHTDDAYTGARKDREGYIVKAGNGTILLDEIGEVDIRIQVKLLRTLQERTVFKVGEDESRAKKISARFVFATNRNLKEEYRNRKSKFREDLFHRISALQIDVPPLRERKADIPLLVRRFVEEFNRDYEDGAIGQANLSVGNVFKLNVLFDYEWTGNVRELRNVVRQAAVLTGEGEIDKKLAELVEKKITEAAKNQSQSSTSPRTQRPREFSSFVSSLLDDTRPKAESRLKKAYEQNLFLKANGNIQEMIKRARLKKTVISKIKAEIKNSLSFSQFEKDDLIDAASLATKLKRPTDPVSTYIYSRLNSHTRNMLNEYREGEPGAMLLDALVNDLNRQLQDHDLYQAERFQKIQLSEDTEDLIKQQGVWTDLFRLNRMLIEDTYPNEIRMSQSVRSVRDGSNEDRQPDSEEEGID